MLFAGFKRHPAVLRMEDALLVVIDMQEPFLRNVVERERVIRNVGLLVRAAEILRVPIVPTLQYAQKMGGPVPEIAAALPSQLIPFDKTCFSCMGDDAFASEVLRSGRKQLLLCGVETHICVCQTALDLVAAGYQVHVAGDSVSSRSKANVRAGIGKMEQSGVILSSAELAIYEMLMDAGAPEFRDILPLVKEA